MKKSASLFSYLKAEKELDINWFNDKETGKRYITRNDVPLIELKQKGNLLYLELGSDPNKKIYKFTLEKWHKRFCHVNINKIKLMSNENSVIGLDKFASSDEFNCEGCSLGKMIRKPSKTVENTMTTPASRLFIDTA